MSAAARASGPDHYEPSSFREGAGEGARESFQPQIGLAILAHRPAVLPRWLVQQTLQRLTHARPDPLLPLRHRLLELLLGLPLLRVERLLVGQRLLLARRLVEVGVSWLTVYSGGWDHHTKLFDAYRGEQVRKLDQGVAALINDLDARGLLDTTLVLLLGEFGRTPKVNKDAGRDHWPHAMSVLMAGAGVPRGQVVGATDAKGYHASENIYRPEDFAASIYTKMGVDPAQMLHTNTGRPVQLVNNGRLIKELFA